MENKKSLENSKVVQRCNKILEKLHDKRKQHNEKNLMTIVEAIG